MTKSSAKPKRERSSGSKIAMEMRERLFAIAFVNGKNATQAAIAAGAPPGKGAAVTGSRLLDRPSVQALIEANAKRVEKLTGLDAERTLKEVARIAYFDPRQTRDAQGNPIPLHMMSDDVAAAVQAEKITVIGDTVVEIDRKFHDKNAALEKAMKFHGHYERDNAQQRGESLKLVVNLV